MRWKNLAVLVAGAMLVTLLAACGEDETPVTSGTVTGTAPVEAPSGTTTTAPVGTAGALGTEGIELGGIWDYAGGTPDGHDPHTLAASFGNDWTVYNSLVQMKFPFDSAKGIEYEPYLATEWSTSEDGSKWRFKLREGVTFHDGELFNADDVVATVRRMLDPDFLVGTQRRVARDVFVGIEKVDEYTVELDTGEADITAFAYLSSHYMQIVPEHLIRGKDSNSSDVDERWTTIGVKEGDSGTYATGTGPFVVTDWKLDLTMNQVKNQNYFKFDEEGRRLPYMDGIKWHDIPEDIRNLAHFVAGNHEYNQGGRCCGMTLRDADALCRRIREEGCFKILSPHGFGHIVSNARSTPIFEDQKVNAAHRYGHNVAYPMNEAFAGGSAWLWVDREYWPDATLSLKEQYDLLPWSNPVREDEYEAKAHELLADAGYPDGVDLPYPFFAAHSSGGLCYGSFLDQQSRHMNEIWNAGFRTILECRAGVNIIDEMKSGRWSINNNYPAINLVTPVTGIIQGGTKTSGIAAREPFPWAGDDVADAKYRVLQKTLDPARQNDLLKDYERYMADPGLPNFMGYYAKVYFSVRGCVHNFTIGGAWGTHRYALERVWLTGACRNASS
jgi:ABC-type transport system substrate-binding protein